MGIMDIFRAGKIKEENQQLHQDLENLQKQIDSLGVTEYYQTKEKMEQLEADAKKKIQTLDQEYKDNLRSINADVDQKKADAKKKIRILDEEYKENLRSINTTIDQKLTAKKNLEESCSSLSKQNESIEKQLATNKKKLFRIKELYKSMDHSINSFFEYDPPLSKLKQLESSLNFAEEFAPSVILKLHYMDAKELRKAYNENNKLIEQLLTQYSSRYTTKANKSIYQLMVVALRAELQNVLYNLKYEKLEKSIDDIKIITQKYLNIAASGNQSIAGTMTKFIGEIEYLFINAVKIEYNYYVKKEQARQEQLAIREQMRQEAEERKALEAERKKIEKEEAKFHNEIGNLEEQLSTAGPNEIENLQKRILELQVQLSNIALKKDEISNLQNGKAGNVYIISNLGSFGKDVFKVGMTRRLDPQDRVNELGSASVPFKFDVHSFIFSDNAVDLESKLHKMLNDKRLNKVNMRKEFFRVSIDELEDLVTEIDPTAEFNKTMLAEEFRQSLSSDENYITDQSLSFDFEKEDDE